ncbi:hypothetical protein PCANC_26415 [Puccinia coronata f. sp. avenae]|uniref:Uncharacterized protein n=1 Tax=Puccinia coronata f. sp. avenae TaxID=200324 RepID=A0A2N5S887_9BASI|nr:hypothetical protein PCANC_26415 [Puccinia coronata f. sp. avenae]
MAASKYILDAAIRGKLGFGQPREIIALVDTQATLPRVPGTKASSIGLKITDSTLNR